MLLELAQLLAKDVRLFNVFSYITLRAVLACLTALAVSLVLGPYFIRKLTAYKIGQAVRDDGPRSHLAKAGTPTMGGALILVAICITTLLWGNLSNRFVWVVLIVMLGFVAAGCLAFSVSADSTPQFVRLFSDWVASGFSSDLSARADLIVPFFKTVS